MLGTQSFASMMAEDLRDLPGIIMSGVYSIFAFAVNGEDADYLSRNELSEKFGGPSRDTLISLDPYTCYARFMRQDGGMSRPFFFRTAAPLVPDPEISLDVLDMRAAYARKRTAAVSDALRYLDRIRKYKFYSAGEEFTSEGSDGDITMSGDETPHDVDRDLNYPDAGTGTGGDIPPSENESADTPEQNGADSEERDEYLRENYGEMFPH